MTQPTNIQAAPEESPQRALARRELLKALAVSGGTIAASTIIPGQWAKPVIEVGLLPAHAQISLIPTSTPVPRPTIISCGGESSFLGSSTEVLFDNDERIINLFAMISPAPPVGTLIRYDVMVNGLSIVIDEPILPAATDAAGLADFGSATVRPIGGFNTLNLGDIVAITFSFEPPVDPMFDATTCTANFTVVGQRP